MDLKYTNKEGISLKKVFDNMSETNKLSKKELVEKVQAKKSIDLLITKLIDMNIVKKIKEGRSVFYILNPSQSEPIVKNTKTKSEELPKNSAEVIDATVVMHQQSTIKKLSSEINQDDLDHLKAELENQTGKPVTTILHTRNEQKSKKIQADIKLTDEILTDIENPYRFVLNFFTDTLNGELATTYFKRRDNYVVKSIYNKFKTICDKIDEYDTNQQHIPFYRAFSIDEETMTVKMYHIDMQRNIRGYHTLFQINEKDKKFIFGENNG